ncbi:restriction endonuclease subunit S [Enterococcus cecorum]|uniref:restriction endonuclease subunit S n=1 Tax=Enterococcus cecorum TaxID=44008 RepID=UPI001FABDD62|nr:restriction endonuclease subunit S [Enterococcus cecorum]MCJ0564095.1 restriction endonuclease subunit S [Enterococcus cecorum]
MQDLKKIRLGDVCKINVDSYSTKEKWDFVNYLDTGNITNNTINSIQFIDLKNNKLPNRAKRKVKTDSIIYSTVRPNQRHFGIIKSQPENFLVSTGFAVIEADAGVLNADFLYYLLTQDTIVEVLHSIAEQSTSAYPAIKPSDIENLEIEIPDLSTQKKIASILNSLDRKIVKNTEINNNLEQQISDIFKKMFGFNIDNLVESKFKLGDLIESIDNRGKTPPLSDKPTSYPIIDVKALSSNMRIVDYNKCSKYVDEETYNTWFRSGHPKQYDILFSTVGSLAEMKLFLGNVGCIAQNVVGFRSRGISSLYLYQYLKYIKNDLVAYNIGSVQPSIKITHIIKYPIYVASQDEINKFDSMARYITEKIFANCQENENLKQLRDTLLPKLMSGEFDVSKIDL